jgi:hypothetical protein
MNPRKTTKLVTFHAPFQLQAMEEMRPAGVYEVTTEQQQIGDFMFDPFRHMSMTIYLPSLTGYGQGQTIPVDPVELKELLRTRYTEPADIVSFGSNVGSLRLEETGFGYCLQHLQMRHVQNSN